MTGNIADLCRTFFYPKGSYAQRWKARRYLAHRLGYPSPGSEFDLTLGDFKYLFRVPGLCSLATALGVTVLQMQRYNALMLQHEGRIIGHTAYQVHEDELHIFSVEVDEEYQGNGLGRHMVDQVLSNTRQRGRMLVRVGAGNHEATDKIFASFIPDAAEFGVVPQQGNWLNIVENQDKVVATLCYLMQDGKTLMQCRDEDASLHKGMYVGVGGHLRPGETIGQCVVREVKEETGFKVVPEYRGVLTFDNRGRSFHGESQPDWYVFVYTATQFEGELRPNHEGCLEWVPNGLLPNLPMWEGDRIFTPWLYEDRYFSARFRYQGDKLASMQALFH